MTPGEFKKKWAKVSAKESAAYQSHFDDLCRLLHLAPPLEADPTGQVFCYQKRVVKDAEFFDLAPGGEVGEPSEREPLDAESAARLKRRTLTNLYNERPPWLDLAHKKLDDAVAAAYRWPANLTGDQILERLLALNLARAAEEAESGGGENYRTSRVKEEDELL
jgi:hypothetical protein